MPYIFPTPRPLTPEKYVFIACFLTSSGYALCFGSIVYTLPHSLHLQRWVPDGLRPTFIWFSLFPQYGHFFHSSSFALLISLLFYHKMFDLGNPPAGKANYAVLRLARRASRRVRVANSGVLKPLRRTKLRGPGALGTWWVQGKALAAGGDLDLKRRRRQQRSEAEPRSQISVENGAELRRRT